MPTDNGFTNQKKKGAAQYETVQPLGSNAFGKPVAPKSLYQITASTAITSVTDILDINGYVKYWNILYTAHGATKGNIARFLSGTLINFEFEVEQVIDANNFYVLPISETKPSTQNCTIMGWVTSKAASDGSISVSVTASDISFQRNGASQVVTQDTGTPANTRPLPIIQYNSSGVEVVPASQATQTTISNTLTSILSKDTYAPLAMARLDLVATPVTTGAWVQLISSVGATAIKRAQIFCSSGYTMEMSFGAAASEVSKMYVFPGGNEVFEIDIPAATRLAVRAITTTSNTGELLINLMG